MVRARYRAGSGILGFPETAPEASYYERDGEPRFRITSYDAMPPFLMSLVGDSDFWVFVSSCGALTAGRGSPDGALFPYSTDDRIHDSADRVGSKTVFRVSRRAGEKYLWEPFSPRYAGLYRLKREISKSAYGHQVEFEEVNEDLGLSFGYSLTTSPRFGLVREARIRNLGGVRGNGDAEGEARVEALDGLLDLMPADLTRRFQSDFSTLADAYHEAELVPLEGAPKGKAGLALYRLSSIPTDRAEPSESLRATTVWSLGLEAESILISAEGLEAFRRGGDPIGEERMRGRRGAYLARAELTLAPLSERSWIVAADVESDAARVRSLLAALRDDRSGRRDLAAELRKDIADGLRGLREIVASADGFQVTEDRLRSWRHYSNALFNAMRGGVPVDGRFVPREDFRAYVADSSRAVASRAVSFLDALPERIGRDDLARAARASRDPDLERLAREYLPLTFSRRHGDPSRPWNSFSIATRDADGKRLVGYEGNWRDIFQNWEALALSHPGYLDGMVFKFLDATTADGFNPYRITRRGVEWEAPNENDPWASIGYWGDHQVAYLLRLLEASERYRPGGLLDSLARPVFAYAQVPYRLRGYEAMLADPRNTVDFDPRLHGLLIERARAQGEDGKLLRGPDGTPYRVCLAEKLLVTALCKLSSYIPDAGIWMNTQRPEWNDANNALVGYGVSVVTLCYLRNLIAFSRMLFAQAGDVGFDISIEVARLTRRVAAALLGHAPARLADLGPGAGEPACSPAERAALMDELGAAGSDYRLGLYERGLSGAREPMAAAELIGVCDVALAHLDLSFRSNARPDGMYHAYNLMKREGRSVEIRRLPLMLEGQVAALNSRILSPEEEASLLEALRASELYRPDQDSYLLYPDRRLAGFLERNNLPPAFAEGSPLARALVERGGLGILSADAEGGLHFDSSLHNARALDSALGAMEGGELGELVAVERGSFLDAYEKLFDHHSFTGRSGSFYKYEGLGCVYWHMVSKLLLAAGEAARRARAEGADELTVARLEDSYRSIREGLGTHKPPAVYGAFPTDPYSHTPSFAGAQQPGMTGQVKEDLLSRFAELGASVAYGRLSFAPSFAAEDEALLGESVLDYVDDHGAETRISVGAGCYAFTICQVPIVVHIAGAASHRGGDGKAGRHIEIGRSDGSVDTLQGLELGPEESAGIFAHSGAARRLDVFFGSA